MKGQAVEESQTKTLQELQQLVDKKAGILDMKRLSSFIENINLNLTENLADFALIKQYDFFLGEKGKAQALTLKAIENKTENFEAKIKQLNQSI